MDSEKSNPNGSKTAYIVLLVLLLIAIIVAVYFGIAYYNRVRRVDELESRVDQLETRVDNFCEQIDELQLDQIQNSDIRDAVDRAQQICR